MQREYRPSSTLHLFTPFIATPKTQTKYRENTDQVALCNRPSIEQIPHKTEHSSAQILPQWSNSKAA